MRIINTADELLSAFVSDEFNIEKWGEYMQAFVPGAKELCLDDMRECVGAGYSWERDFLPVLNAVKRDAQKRELAAASFRTVTENLDERMIQRFGRTVEADVILYLGLCNGAGWVTEVNGRTAVLLGIEKIMELDWCGVDSMIGLLYHELGHVYHSQYGALHVTTETPREGFIRQLFNEGVAMVFEQEIVGDPSSFHQYDEEWKEWCTSNAELIRSSFCNDLDTMTSRDQRYFGDWVRFMGHGDTGYFLGALFVRFLLRSDSFDSIIAYGSERVARGFERFMRSPL